MIAEAGFCDVTGLTHSLDLEGNTFIPSLASLTRERHATDLLNVLQQQHELSKKPAKRGAFVRSQSNHGHSAGPSCVTAPPGA